MTVSTVLTAATVPQYLGEKANDIGIFPSDAKLSARSIQGGNINYAFCATEEASNKSIFVKQAPGFVAVFGPGPDGLPLTSERMKKEIAVYQEWKEILGDELCAKYLPNIYLFDNHMMVFVMDFLGNHTLLDQVLFGDENLNKDVAKGLGKFMGRTHAATHSSKVSSQRFDNLQRSFENRPMRDIQLQYVFTKCYNEATDEQKAGFQFDEAFMNEVESLKAAYEGGNTDNLSLCHGDLHPGSIMVNGGDVKVIDPEFAIYGPPGLDVGTLLSGYILAAVHQRFCNNEKAANAILEGIKDVWYSYVANLRSGDISEEIISKIEVEAVGFASAEVCRTVLGFAGVRKWLQFEDPQVKLNSTKAALEIVQECMIYRHEGGMKLIIDAMGECINSCNTGTP